MMRDILTDLKRWREKDKSIALATVVRTWGSSPRGVGSKMAISSDGEVIGSVSGGCVENAVFEAGLQSLETNQPALLQFGVADESAWEVGLACGGSLDVFVNPLDNQLFEELRFIIENEQPAVLATVVRGPKSLIGREFVIRDDEYFTDPPGDQLDEPILNLASEVLYDDESQAVALNAEVDVFFESITTPLTLITVGGVHIAVALTSVAKTLGYRTVVIDPRKVWGNRARFPDVDQLVQAWPDEAFNRIKVTNSTAVATLTHDPKLDDPALHYALSSPAFYIGALGSKTTQAKRRERLMDDGLTEKQLSRLHAPIGLDIGAQTSEEIALAIMAEVVDAHHKRKQQSRRETRGNPVR